MLRTVVAEELLEPAEDDAATRRPPRPSVDPAVDRQHSVGQLDRRRARERRADRHLPGERRASFGRRLPADDFGENAGVNCWMAHADRECTPAPAVSDVARVADVDRGGASSA